MKASDIVREDVAPGYFMVVVPQALRKSADRAIKQIRSLEVIASGYSDGSTTWSFIVNADTDKDSLSDAIRKAMGGYAEYLRVTAMSQDEVDQYL